MPGPLAHTGLFFSIHSPLDEIEADLRRYWQRQGYGVKRVEIPKPASGRQGIDRAGHGTRFWIYAGQVMVLSYEPNCHGSEILGKIYDRHARGLHVAFSAIPAEYKALRSDPAFERETDGWDNGAHSVFHTGPWGLEVEYVILGLIPSDEDD